LRVGGAVADVLSAYLGRRQRLVVLVQPGLKRGLLLGAGAQLRGHVLARPAVCLERRLELRAAGGDRSGRRPHGGAQVREHRPHRLVSRDRGA
jgi:hypothetical protein